MEPAESDGRAEMVLRPLVEGDEAELLRIHTTSKVIRWWDFPHDGFPWDEPESTRLTIVIDGVVAGLIQYTRRTSPSTATPGSTCSSIPHLHGRGYGSEAVRRVVRLMIDERGHHRITIDPAVENVAAIGAYEKAGFKSVGVMRQAERDADGDGWHDALLMELLAGEQQ